MSTEHRKYRNALAGETSPYLLQHADNPVDWHPWNEAALEKARQEGKPILLSIGYSACHWCHVMAHESFEDEETAAIMNRHFINIKVDREERPDLDRIYQLAQQMLTRRGGGWPLTMFLTHDDLMPFFGGTYFPAEPRYGLPGFREVLLRVADFYRTEQDAIRRQNESLQRALTASEADRAAEPDEIDEQPLRLAFEQLEQHYDARHGGFGDAPKFPSANHIERLLRHWAREADPRALEMALNTLERMAAGGIYDHIGGGFCRYSVDAEWTIPHFEKMLYDNGPLLALYAEAWQVSGNERFRQVAEETAGWTLREMRSSEGGFCSSLDADSEGEEGKYYLWTPEEVRAALQDQPEADRMLPLITRHYGLDRPANFEGRWHLRIIRPLAEVAGELSLAEEEARRLLDRARQRLFEVRERRVRPGRDDKLLTSWNALMIRGLAVAGHILERQDWLDAAQAALDCIRNRLWINGRLRATWKDGRARHNAYLDDYAFLLHAILALLQARWRRDDLDFAIELAEILLAHYADPQAGGFYFTADDHERLIQRSKPFMDESLPSGNGIAAFALQRLGHLLGEPRYLEAAAATLRAGWPSLARVPFAHAALLLALEEYLEPPQLVIVRLDSEDPAPWVRIARPDYRPQRLMLVIPAAEAGLPGQLAHMTAADGPRAYVCSGSQCLPPVEDPEALRALLEH